MGVTQCHNQNGSVRFFYKFLYTVNFQRFSIYVRQEIIRIGNLRGMENSAGLDNCSLKYRFENINKKMFKKISIRSI